MSRYTKMSKSTATISVLEIIRQKGQLTTGQIVEQTGLDKNVVRGVLAQLSRSDAALVKRHAELGSQPVWSLTENHNVSFLPQEVEEEQLLRVVVSRDKIFHKQIRVVLVRSTGEQEVLLMQPVTFYIQSGSVKDARYKDVVSLRIEELDDHGEVVSSYAEKIKEGEILLISPGIQQ